MLCFIDKATQKFEEVDKRLTEIQRTLASVQHSEPGMNQGSSENVQMPAVDSEAQYLSPNSPYSSTDGLQAAPEMPGTTQPRDWASEGEEESGDPGPPKPPSIPVNHTTAAWRLLLVRPIAKMLKDFPESVKLKDQEYLLHLPPVH